MRFASASETGEYCVNVKKMVHSDILAADAPLRRVGQPKPAAAAAAAVGLLGQFKSFFGGSSSTNPAPVPLGPPPGTSAAASVPALHIVPAPILPAAQPHQPYHPPQPPPLYSALLHPNPALYPAMSPPIEPSVPLAGSPSHSARHVACSELDKMGIEFRVVPTSECPPEQCAVCLEALGGPEAFDKETT